ncbi:MAG: methyltransferase domain-containing protein [Desulfobacterales bacterium]|nr:methyltransferase domain-containing protein [Desulfobacterales bacterium]
MNIAELIHKKYIFNRRIHVLCEKLARIIPRNVIILDVGCGDGYLDALLMQRRTDISIKGIDVLLRDKVHIPVEVYKTDKLPYKDSSFDVVMFIDVLHHSKDPEYLLREAVRISRDAIIIKDHLLNGILAGSTLRFMDNIGNVRHNVYLSYNYWTREKWLQTIETIGMSVNTWQEALQMYPWPANLIFDRNLHFISELKNNKKNSKDPGPEDPDFNNTINEINYGKESRKWLL